MSDLTPQTSAFTLREVPARDEVIRIDAEGFHYLGQFIADAGEAYQLLVEFLHKQRQAPVPVSEQLPGPEDCDVEHYCWRWNTIGGLWARQPLARRWYEFESHWLPAHALPLPEVSNG